MWAGTLERVVTEWPEICSHTYLDDPLSVLPGVVVLSVLAEDVGDEVELLRRVVEPLHHHPPVMPARGKALN